MTRLTLYKILKRDLRAHTSLMLTIVFRVFTQIGLSGSRRFESTRRFRLHDLSYWKN